jgi:hypothetical protein
MIWFKKAHHGHGGLGNGDYVTDLKAAWLKLSTKSSRTFKVNNYIARFFYLFFC